MRRGVGGIRQSWLLALLVALMAVVAGGSHAQAETRSLKLYFIHTKERAEIVYKRNGRYDQDGLNKINRFLRDWRRNEPAKMDPRLLDLVWSVYRSVGARDYIHVVSAYRSPATNSMLRGRSSGVAEKSQHMLGKAMDFYIPGVALSKLRAAAFKAEGGGVGYYPKSGAPFVHLDVGNVRSWPRMSRSELMALFPDGRTIHVPTDGKPLPGFKQALAAYEARKKSGGQIQVASVGSSRSGGDNAGSADNRTVASFLANVFRGGGADEEEDDAPVAVAASPAPRSAPAAAPAAAPEPVRETIVAALPERNAPLPALAPRPLVDVGAPARPLIEGMPAQAQEQQQPTISQEADALLVANVPVPTRRPDYAPVQVALNEALPRDVPIAAIAGERPRDNGTEAISELLAMSATEAKADVVINGAPVPELRPQLAGNEGALSQQDATSATGNMFVLAPVPEVNPQAGQAAPVLPQAPEVQMASLEASPRTAVLRRDRGASAAAALDSGVRTTGKGARPQATQARRDPKSVVVPVERQLTRWAFQRDVTVATAGGKAQPDKAYNMVWSSPDTVYTSGFQQAAPQPAEVSRFTGKAVTFMSVARFGND